MPSITKTSRAFIHAHNLSKPPIIGGPKKVGSVLGGETTGTHDDIFDAFGHLIGTKDGVVKTPFYDPMADPMTSPGDGYIWDDEFGHRWVKSTGLGGFHTVSPGLFTPGPGVTATGGVDTSPATITTAAGVGTSDSTIFGPGWAATATGTTHPGAMTVDEVLKAVDS